MSTVKELEPFIENAIVVDVREANEIITLGDGIEGSLNIHYNPDLPTPVLFLDKAQDILPADLSTPIIVH